MRATTRRASGDRIARAVEFGLEFAHDGDAPRRQGTVNIAMMTRGVPAHTLAADVDLRPVLLGLGASLPTPAVSLGEAELVELDRAIDDGWYAPSTTHHPAELGRSRGRVKPGDGPFVMSAGTEDPA